MSVLTTKTRNKLPASKFAGPDRSYPVPDKPHAANAKARASQQAAKGKLSKSEEAKIDAKADKVLAGGKNQPHKHTEISTDRGKFAFRENLSNKKPEKK